MDSQLAPNATTMVLRVETLSYFMSAYLPRKWTRALAGAGAAVLDDKQKRKARGPDAKGGRRYGELESAALGAELGALRLPAAAEDAEAAVLALAGAAATGGAAAAAALERCGGVSGGTALPDARAVVDRELAQLAQRMQARPRWEHAQVGCLHVVSGPQAGAAGAAHAGVAPLGACCGLPA